MNGDKKQSAWVDTLDQKLVDSFPGRVVRKDLYRDFGSYDFNIQVISPNQGKDATDIGIAFYIAIAMDAGAKQLFKAIADM